MRVYLISEEEEWRDLNVSNVDWHTLTVVCQLSAQIVAEFLH